MPDDTTNHSPESDAKESANKVDKAYHERGSKSALEALNNEYNSYVSEHGTGSEESAVYWQAMTSELEDSKILPKLDLLDVVSAQWHTEQHQQPPTQFDSQIMKQLSSPQTWTDISGVDSQITASNANEILRQGETARLAVSMQVSSGVALDTGTPEVGQTETLSGSTVTTDTTVIPLSAVQQNAPEISVPGNPAAVDSASSNQSSQPNPLDLVYEAVGDAMAPITESAPVKLLTNVLALAEPGNYLNLLGHLGSAAVGTLVSPEAGATVERMVDAYHENVLAPAQDYLQSQPLYKLAPFPIKQIVSSATIGAFSTDYGLDSVAETPVGRTISTINTVAQVLSHPVESAVAVAPAVVQMYNNYAESQTVKEPSSEATNGASTEVAISASTGVETSASADVATDTNLPEQKSESSDLTVARQVTLSYGENSTVVKLNSDNEVVQVMGPGGYTYNLQDSAEGKKWMQTFPGQEPFDAKIRLIDLNDQNTLTVMLNGGMMAQTFADGSTRVILPESVSTADGLAASNEVADSVVEQTPQAAVELELQKELISMSTVQSGDGWSQVAARMLGYELSANGVANVEDGNWEPIKELSDVLIARFGGNIEWPAGIASTSIPGESTSLLTAENYQAFIADLDSEEHQALKATLVQLYD